jgi:hypothetical protein
MNTSAEVAEWGERWLKEWLSDRPKQDRETDEWVANNWRSVDLQGVMRWWQEDNRASFERYEVDHEVGDLLGLYRWTRNGLAVWRMYRAYRDAGLPVHEKILEKLDQWAARLERARGADAVAAAIEMTTKRGGATGAAALKKAERCRSVASDVHLYTTFWGDRSLSPMEAYARVAKERRMTPGAVKALWQRWQAETRQASTSTVDEAMRRMINREPGTETG